ncbi:MAG: sugar ABC transporter substrate-binding protein [Microbacterium sp.]
MLSLAACAGNGGGGASSGDQITVACIVKDASAAIWKAAIAGCEEAGEELGVTIISGGGTGDTDLQGELTAFQNAITKGAQGVALAATDSAGMLSTVNGAAEDGVKIATFDSTVDGGDLVTNVVGDDEQGAYDAGNFLAEQIGGEGKVAITTCSQSITTCKAVMTGFEKAMAEHPDIEIVGRPLATPNRDKAFQAIQNILGANPDLKGVYSTYDLDGLGALAAGEAAGVPLVVVSRGCSMEALESIEEGGLTACNALFPKKEAYTAVKAIVEAIEGGDSEALIKIPSAVVDKASVGPWLETPEFMGPPSE